MPKSHLYFLIIVVFWISSLNHNAYGQSTIKYDPANKTLIPFDQPFVLQIDSFKNGDVKKVMVYEIKYVNGRRDILDRSKTTDERPSFTLYPADCIVTGTTIKLNFPALKPDHDFDGLIYSSFSKPHIAMAMKVNKDMYLNNALTPDQMGNNDDISKDFWALYNDVNKSPTALYSRVVFNYDVAAYKTGIFDNVVPFYNHIINVDINHATRPNDFSNAELKFMYDELSPDILLKYNFYALQNIQEDVSMKQVFNGFLPAAYGLPVTPADQFDLDKRTKNLKLSISYLDSLDRCISLTKFDDYASFNDIRKKIRAWIKGLGENLTLIQNTSDQIAKYYKDNCTEGYWFTQGTQSPDLTTTGTRHVTLDAGIMNIGAFDNKSHYTNIQKLFLGLNFYFVSIDKNVSFDRIIKPDKEGPDDTHFLESRNSLLQRLCITGGFTLGAYQNKDFDNVFSGMSFTLGPGIRLWKAVRLSAGVALLKRTSLNPVETTSSLAVGNYVSLSLDYDLLNAAKNITGLIFK